MRKDLFYYFGKCTYHLRWLILIIWLLLLLTSIPFAPELMDPFKTIGFTNSHSESARANETLNKKLGFGYTRFIVIYGSKKLLATQPEFRNEIEKSLSGLKKISTPHQITYPDPKQNKQISHDKHSAYIVVAFKGNQEVDPKLIHEFKTKIKKPKNLTMRMGGEPIFLDDIKEQTQIDLFKAEYIATPIAIITLLIVFESVVAALLPIILGGIGAILIFLTLFTLGHYFSLSVFTINIALLLGTCLSIDYALLIVNRFRIELKEGKPPDEAIAITETTAGKAVFFSGGAVFISLSALLLFPVNILFSVGIGGLAAVSISVAVALILLPAVLSILNTRINSLPIRIFKKSEKKEHTYWQRFIRMVATKPLPFFFISLTILILLGYPFLSAKFDISDVRILPKTQDSRQVYETFKTKFGENKLTPILAIIETPKKNILTKNNIGHLYDFASRVMKNRDVESIDSIVSTKPRMTKMQYETLYTQPKLLTPDLKKLLELTTYKNMTLMTIMSKHAGTSPLSHNLVKKLRAYQPGNKMTLKITGFSANTADVKKSIVHTFPYAFLWIICFTYIILLILFRSIFLPFKAILLTILSLCASYGVLVVIFQDGHLHQLLNFEPQGMLDISLLIIIFCALFGISMDYEVFLLASIKEHYEKTQNHIQSIVFGIERSSKIISSAAIIVILICLAFMSADVLMVKALGLGIAVAVFVDAFIIRLVLVPATMALLKQLNWYLPSWLGAILPNITFNPEDKH